MNKEQLISHKYTQLYVLSKTSLNTQVATIFVGSAFV